MMIVSFIYFSDPGLFVYCCDFSTTAVDLVQVNSLVIPKIEAHGTNCTLTQNCHSCHQLSSGAGGFLDLASPDAGKSGKPAVRIVEMREVGVLNMSGWQQTGRPGFLSPVAGALGQIQRSFG